MKKVIGNAKLFKAVA